MFFNCHEEQKIYIMGNNIWREEILKYIKLTNISDFKKYNKIIKKDNFIIRIYEPGLNKNEQIYINKLIDEPNKAEIYSFIKSRDLPFITQNNKYFIEIEKKYERLLKLDKINILEFIKQMTYCQMNLFIYHGIVHNNIHANNIFIANINKDLTYIRINKTIKASVHYILSDFTKCKIYHPSKFSGFTEKKIYDESILKNLEDIIKLTFILSETKPPINIKIPIIIKKAYYKLTQPYINYNDNNHIEQNYQKYINYEQNYENFIIQTINLCWKYITPIINLIEFE
jgi:hypothetical protein